MRNLYKCLYEYFRFPSNVRRTQGQDGMVLFDTEAFPMVNIHCPTSVEDLPEGQCKQQ